MPFPYKTVLMIGCTAGIGLALAERMIENGIFVIGVGRRKERLDAFVARHGSSKAAASQFDITNLNDIKDWAAKITKTYPDIDCVFLNSGVQRGLNFTKPEAIDLTSVQQELHELQEDLRARGPTDFGMPLAEFTDQVWDALTKGKDEIPVGINKDRFVNGEDERREMFQQMVKMAGTT
ncbi:hypothetical protein DL766_007444 [Monosporascus sp. MC13-8B]|uniref:Ketoreductase (KR) domain-containing protein n=1 Tax=Monosporascus cannonballus TaxID=155416 RepID=A0ABY0HHG5_9PEZI|nr:hypothetical protein DL762_002609 [Monosporascus cannonballus]RYP01569.1 hypothetical protein DL763_000100 [Monosporascus cannonballus]RYP23788.1 hypothetical protein DL766_007444 [Monosporascus sp. MC13-8B]